MYVDTQIADIINSAPGILDTLQELANALQNNPDIIQDLQDAIANKVNKAGDTMTGSLDMNINSITNLAAPTNNGDATNKQYVDGSVSGRLTEAQADARYYLNTTPLNQIGTATGDIDVDFQRILNVGNAATATDALSWVVADTLYYR